MDSRTLKSQMLYVKKMSIPYGELDRDEESGHSSRLLAVQSEGGGKDDSGVLQWQPTAR